MVGWCRGREGKHGKAIVRTPHCNCAVLAVAMVMAKQHKTIPGWITPQSKLYYRIVVLLCRQIAILTL